ncbi:unnamed protein product, partial [Rotaria sp. Silwood1]
MNETSNMNSGNTGGVCSSCLKEMPIVMASSSNNPLSKLCSNCMTEFVDQQRFSSDINNKFPLLPPTQSILNNQQQQQQQQQAQSIFQPHFSHKDISQSRQYVYGGLLAKQQNDDGRSFVDKRFNDDEDIA